VYWCAIKKLPTHSPTVVVCGVDTGQKRCQKSRDKKQRSEQSLDSTSKQPAVAELTDAVHSADAAAAAAAVDSNSTLVDSNGDASELLGQCREPIIGSSLVAC